MVENFQSLGTGKEFFDLIEKSQPHKQKIN